MIQSDLELDLTRGQATKFRVTIRELERQEKLLLVQLEACRSVLKDLEEEMQTYYDSKQK